MYWNEKYPFTKFTEKKIHLTHIIRMDLFRVSPQTILLLRKTVIGVNLSNAMHPCPLDLWELPDLPQTHLFHPASQWHHLQSVLLKGYSNPPPLVEIQHLPFWQSLAKSLPAQTHHSLRWNCDRKGCGQDSRQPLIAEWPSASTLSIPALLTFPQPLPTVIARNPLYLSAGEPSGPTFHDWREPQPMERWKAPPLPPPRPIADGRRG